MTSARFDEEKVLHFENLALQAYVVGNLVV